MSDLNLNGKAALVTGGALRLGRAIALALARAGADVTITCRNSRSDALDAVKAMQAMGRSAQAVECDIRSEGSVRAAVSAAAAFHHRLDIVVNNAAVFSSAPFDTLSLEQWDEVFETNARGPFLVSREALPHLRVTGGRIINIGSLGGTRPWATHAHYCSSKAALHMLTQSMAKALAPEVSVNCVAPGFVDYDESAGEPATAHFAQKTPMGRNATATDVTDAVLFFAAGPGFITGQTLTVDGGLGL